jgi:hypothetical protein
MPAPAAPDVFVSLFNGQDLTGWEGDPRWWKVVEPLAGWNRPGGVEKANSCQLKFGESPGSSARLSSPPEKRPKVVDSESSFPNTSHMRLPSLGAAHNRHHFLIVTLILSAACLCLALDGCGKKSLDLSGNWELTLPKGAKHQSPIERVSENTYRIPGLKALSGVYELRGDKLVVTVPTDQRLTEYVWQVQDANTLILVEAPPPGKTGSDYRGATLVRSR